jgi:hypothetical protein
MSPQVNSKPFWWEEKRAAVILLLTDLFMIPIILVLVKDDVQLERI